VTKWARACRFPSSPRRAAIGSADLCPSTPGVAAGWPWAARATGPG
jgi:hypothetical protein